MKCGVHGQLDSEKYYTYQSSGKTRRICKQCAHERNANSYAENREERNSIVSQWRKDNRDKDRATQQRYESKDPEKWKQHRREKENERSRSRRVAVICHYGGSPPKCACPGCNETVFEFLTIDHINNDGFEHRKTIGSGTPMYLWIVKNHFPPMFQVLCWNCNACKGIYGRCTFHLQIGQSPDPSKVSRERE
jgi:hypothetical protein